MARMTTPQSTPNTPLPNAGLRWHGRIVSANVSLLFTELPLLERFEAAARAGFSAVESWWPFATAAPGEAEVEQLLGRIEAAGVQLTGMNAFAGDMAAGERGIACDPARTEELEASLAVLHRIAERTGCRGFNLLHGQVVPGKEASARSAAVDAVRRAAATMADLPGAPGTILLEPLARGLNGSYPLHTAQDVLELLDEADAPNSALLLDTFHLARNEEALPAVIRGAGDRIGHVQLADSPDRGEPGSGTIAFEAVAAALEEVGYTGTVAAEYKPSAETLSTLGWLEPAPGATMGMM